MGLRQNDSDGLQTEYDSVSFRWRKTMVAFRQTTVVGFRQRTTVVASHQQQQSWVTVWVSGKTENNRSWPTVDLCLKPTTLTVQHWRSPSKANHCCSPFKTIVAFLHLKPATVTLLLMPSTIVLHLMSTTVILRLKPTTVAHRCCCRSEATIIVLRRNPTTVVSPPLSFCV